MNTAATMPTYKYLFAQTTIESDIPLPGAAIICAQNSFGLQIRKLKAQELATPPCIGATTFTSDGNCRVDLGPYATFEISADGSVVNITPGADTSASLLQHIVVDHVLPQRFALLGHIALHATGVELRGGVVAMIGPSGQGKSTLSAALVASGASWVADDFLLVDVAEPTPSVRSTILATRLCEDSATALGMIHSEGEVIMTGAEKRRWNVAPENVAPNKSELSLPLHCLIALDRRADTDGPPVLAQVGAAAAIPLVASQWFLAGTSAIPQRTFFEKLGTLLRNTPVMVLSYPDNLHRLSDVVNVVRDFVLHGVGVPATATPTATLCEVLGSRSDICINAPESLFSTTKSDGRR
jgi:hypothetical protein